MSDFDVIIIGGGISGLLSALTLGKHGKSVLLLEKSSSVGGNCNSYVVDGFQVDTGVHAITHLQAGPLRRLIDYYFDFMPVFIDHGTYYVRTEKGLSKIPSNLKEFATFDVLPKVDTLLLSQAITKAITLNTFGVDLTNQSVYDNIPRNLSQDTFDFVDAMCYSLSGKSMKETSVNRVLTGTSFLRDRVPEDIFETQPQPSAPLPGIAGKIVEQISISQLASHLTSLGRLATNRIAYAQAYPRGGLKTLLHSVLYSMPANVAIKTGVKVEKIIAENGAATGVQTKDGYLSAPNIVYSGFAKQLPQLLDGLPKEYFDNLARIDQTLSLTIWLGLSKKMDEFSYTGSEIWFKPKSYWAMPISNYCDGIAPKGKQLVGFTFTIDETKGIEDEKRAAFESILAAVPGIEKHIEMTHHQIVIPEKAAVTLNGYFADVRSPVKNLYIVGTDTDKRSMGITRASYSVLELLKIMKDDGTIKPPS